MLMSPTSGFRSAHDPACGLSTLLNIFVCNLLSSAGVFDDFVELISADNDNQTICATDSECNQPVCIFGVYDYNQEVCVCLNGFTGAICDTGTSLSSLLFFLLLLLLLLY